MTNSLAANLRNDSLTRVRMRANGVSVVDQAGDINPMPFDLAFVTDSDPGRRFPRKIFRPSDQGQTRPNRNRANTFMQVRRFTCPLQSVTVPGYRRHTI